MLSCIAMAHTAGVLGRCHCRAGQGTYHATIKFAETRRIAAQMRTVTILINGDEVVSGMDIAATAARADGGTIHGTNQAGLSRGDPWYGPGG